MFCDIARRASVSALVCSLSVLAGCTALISEKPVFGAADYDTSGSLLGHYKMVDESTQATQVLATRGPEGRMVLLGFEVKKAAPTNNPEPGAQTDKHDVLVQGYYAEAAAIPLGGGDFALQVSCAALIEDGKIYASYLGGKKSPYRNYTAYGVIAQDRMKDYLWVSTNFYSREEDTDLIFNRYAVAKAPENNGKDYDVRIIPPDISRSAAVALFRDLIAQDMNADSGSELYKRTDRDPQPSDDETAAIVLNSSEQCQRVQNEGEPPPK
jgi:hypothetical protein